MLREPRRLVSSALAIILGVAFTCATLILGSSLSRSYTDQVAGRVGDASVVVTGSALSPATVKAIGTVPGVTATRPLVEYGTMVGTPEFYVQIVPHQVHQLVEQCGKPLHLRLQKRNDGRCRKALVDGSSKAGQPPPRPIKRFESNGLLCRQSRCLLRSHWELLFHNRNVLGTVAQHSEILIGIAFVDLFEKAPVSLVHVC